MVEKIHQTIRQEALVCFSFVVIVCHRCYHCYCYCLSLLLLLLFFVSYNNHYNTNRHNSYFRISHNKFDPWLLNKQPRNQKTRNCRYIVEQPPFCRVGDLEICRTLSAAPIFASFLAPSGAYKQLTFKLKYITFDSCCLCLLSLLLLLMMLLLNWLDDLVGCLLFCCGCGCSCHFSC